MSKNGNSDFLKTERITNEIEDPTKPERCTFGVLFCPNSEAICSVLGELS